MIEDPIQQYYDNLAPEYDSDRFGNTYGQYIHTQEQRIIDRWMQDTSPKESLDMGCGTGRFLKYAHHGIDISEQMLMEAKRKFPNHQLQPATITKTPFDAHSFQAVFSLHVFFHLEKNVIQQTIREAHRILKPNGLLIFDFPSQARRNLVKYQKGGWHGNTALSIEEVQDYIDGLFIIEKQQGVMMFPVHRVPKAIRKSMLSVDTLLCQSFLKKWASYNLVLLRRLY